MKHSNFFRKYQDVEAQELRELAAAVKAHGGEYIFFDCSAKDANTEWANKEDKHTLPVVCGGNRWVDDTERMYVTRIQLDENGAPIIYGFREEFGFPADETVITIIEYGYLDSIIDEIPETEDVDNVSEQVVGSM